MSKSQSHSQSILIVGLASLAAIVSTGAHATTPAYCNGYANIAVNQYYQAKGKGCSVNGPRWHANKQTHFNWCLGLTSKTPAKSERKARKNFLASCTPSAGGGTGGGVNPVCHLYANEAVKAAAQAAVLGCGFSGPRWIQNYQAHYKWCMAVKNPTLGMHEHVVRKDMLASCKASASGGAGGNAGDTLPSGGDWIFADSHLRHLTRAEVSTLSSHQLWVARNEIFARKGYIFKSNAARAYFNSQTWYQPLYMTVALNNAERSNVSLIRSYE